MTVRELIAELQTRDQDAVVMYPSGHDSATVVLDVSENETWKDISRQPYQAVVLNRHYVDRIARRETARAK